MLTERGKLGLKVFYTWGESAMENKFDPGFGKVVEWDIPLLEGYEYEFLVNVAADKGSHHFKGIINPAIVQRINDYNPDAILVFGWSFQSHLKLLRHYGKKKLILFRGDSTLLDEQPGFRAGMRKRFLKWVYRHIDYALYVGKNNYDYFIRMGMKKNQLILAPHATDNKRFAADSEGRAVEAAGLRRSLGIPEDRFVFLFAGKLEEKKDVRTLLNAFKQSGLGNRADLLIVGNGPQEAELKASFEKESSIHFMDFQNQSMMPVVYRMGDVFVLPSKGPGETWGLALNEAMASSKAVLASDRCGGAVDLIDEGLNGYIFKAGDAGALAAKMVQLADAGRERLEQMGHYSSEKIRSFSFESFCEVTEQLISGFKKKSA